MAIPFNLPSDEETEDVHRRLDQLLLDLYDLLRQILLRQRVVREPRARNERTEPPESLRHAHDQEARDDDEEDAERQHGVTDNRVALLPDLVLGTLIPSTGASKSPVPPPRRKRRRHEKQWTDEVEGGRSSSSTPPRPSPSWLNVGIELRQIAEEFTYNAQTGEGLTKKRSELKASSLFSLLVPPPLTGTVWTTVIILVGWRLLARQR